MLTVHHLGISQSERIVWLCEELAIPYELKRYDRDAVFWGTSSQTLRDTPDLIRDYFKGVPTSSMTVAVTDSRVRVLGNVAVNTGYYTFTAMRNGQPDPRPARFSFTYRRRDGKWLIVDHHSSSVPAAPR